MLEPELTPIWASQRGLGSKSLHELAEEPALLAELRIAVGGANAKLARVEGVKKFTVVKGDWLPGGDELPPTMKLKRK